MKPGAGFAELLVGGHGSSSGFEGFARGELGWHFAPTASAFAFGEAALTPGLTPSWQLGAGVRATW